jgi:peptidoglycan/xylan/chitin deacetylase (PgdA/CDA1 family)
VPIKFTTVVDEFVAHNGLKMTYSKAPLGKEFFVKSHDLLFEQGLDDVEIAMSTWDDIPCFFSAGKVSTIPFDIFAASFYLISRYEEYLPFVQDQYERYPASESLAFKNNFLQKPLVDIWAYKFLKSLQEKFPDYEYKTREFEFISTIDVDNVFAYKEKGIWRNVGGFVRDLLTFRLEEVLERILVLLNFRKDPYDTFDQLLKLSKEHKFKTIFFFLIGDYTKYDTNVSSSNAKYRSLIKSVSDFVDVGLHPSYFTMKNDQKLKREKKKLEGIVNKPILKSRQHYLRFKLPETYQNLIDLDIVEDYSMSYADQFGFRASTCTPFYFYDLDFEIQTPLKIYPTTIMDTTLNDYLNLVPPVAKSKINLLLNETKNVNGCFVMLFHNETLSENKRWKGWNAVYVAIVSQFNKQ